MNRRVLIEGYCAEGPAAGGAAAPPQSFMSSLLVIKAYTGYAAVWALGVLKGRGGGFHFLFLSLHPRLLALESQRWKVVEIYPETEKKRDTPSRKTSTSAVLLFSLCGL